MGFPSVIVISAVVLFVLMFLYIKYGVIREFDGKIKGFSNDINKLDKEQNGIINDVSMNKDQIKLLFDNMHVLLRDQTRFMGLWINEMVKVFSDKVDMTKTKEVLLENYIPIQETLRLVEMRICNEEELRGHLWWLEQNGTARALPHLMEIMNWYKDNESINSLCRGIIELIGKKNEEKGKEG